MVSKKKIEIVFQYQKQSIPMINNFVEMNFSLCLICFSISAKMQRLVDKGVFLIQKFKIPGRNGRETKFGTTGQ